MRAGIPILRASLAIASVLFTSCASRMTAPAAPVPEPNRSCSPGEMLRETSFVTRWTYENGIKEPAEFGPCMSVRIVPPPGERIDDDERVDCDLCEDISVECIGGENGQDLLRVVGISVFSEERCDEGTLFFQPSEWTDTLREHTRYIRANQTAHEHAKAKEAALVRRLFDRYEAAKRQP